MEEIMLTQKEEKRSLKKEISKLSRTLIYYEAAMFLPTIIIITYLALRYTSWDLAIGDVTLDSEAYNAAVEASSGLMSILGIAMGMIIILIYRKKEFIYDLKTTKLLMTFKSFLLLLSVVMALRLPYTGTALALEAILNQFGYSFYSYFESLGSITDTPAMILYASILGPIAEEIVFRGAVLRKLENRGKIFAIVISSILFGVFHGNVPQGIYAALVGMVLAYITLEYSIIWAIVLHIINNSVSTLISFYNITDILSYALDGLFLVAGLAVLIKYRKKIKNYLLINKTEKHRYSVAFTSFWLLLFIAFNLIMGVILIEKIV